MKKLLHFTQEKVTISAKSDIHSMRYLPGCRVETRQRRLHFDMLHQ